MVFHTSDGFVWASYASSGRTGLATDAVVSSLKGLKARYDVIIIGAGFAGLTAARDLAASQDCSVLLVEARDRIGGRTCTVKELGQEIEIGGQWLHWWQPHVYRELSRYGLDGNLVAADSDTEDILGMKEDELDTLLADFFTIGNLTARDLMPWPMNAFRSPAPWKQYDHLSLRDRLDAMPHLSTEAKSFIDLNCTANSGTDAASTSFIGALRWYALGGYSFAGSSAVAATYKIGNGGMTSLAKAMLDETKCERLFDTTVSRIVQEDDAVTVGLASGRTLKADRVICTIPLNVLSTIAFEPPLPALQQEAVDRGMPHKGGKIIFQSNDRQSCSAFGSRYGKSPFMFSMSDHHSPASDSAMGIAFTWSEGFSRTNDLTDTHTVVPALEELIKAEKSLKTYVVHDWANDPYARGAWMAYRPGEMSKYSEALQQTHGRIIMASADWAKGFAGFVDGAIEQGARAAVEVIKDLRG